MDKKQAIIAITQAHLAAHGFHAAGVEQLAAAANITKRTLYNHFGSKENLFQAIVNDFLSQRQNLKAITYNPKVSLEEQLLAFAHAEIFLIDSQRRLGLSRFLTTVFLF